MFACENDIDRSRLFSRLSEDVILANYRSTYNLSDEITIDHVKRHAKLEAELTDKILSSSIEDRAAVCTDAYSTLYSKLPWLADNGTSADVEYWRTLMPRGATVYEVGSGAGHLCNYLNLHGIGCVRTDISVERSSTNIAEFEHPIQVTDGVRLSEFAERGFYDFVISDQVVEHLHPEDLIKHFSEARKLLKPGGAYIFRAPHVMFGPRDLSRVFGEPKAVFMHLHEFSWRDVKVIARECGYVRARAVFRMPKISIAFPSGLYYRYLLTMEGVLEAAPQLRRWAKLFLTPHQVWAALETK